MVRTRGSKGRPRPFLLARCEYPQLMKTRVCVAKESLFDKDKIIYRIHKRKGKKKMDITSLGFVLFLGGG